MRSRLNWTKPAFYTIFTCIMLAMAPVPWRIGVVRPNRDRAAAVFALRSIAEAQERFQRLAAVDIDGDGIGEYGYFVELADHGANVDLEFPLLSRRFTAVDENGCVKSSGYCFRMCLGSEPVPEAPGGGRVGLKLDDSAEQYWICYAWPVSGTEGAGKAFYCDQDGIVMECGDYRLTPSSNRPVAGTWLPLD